jgi:hypothetical protein
MNLQAVLSKTAKGVEEFETRKYKLDQRSRALLIVVNGKSSAGELLKKFEAMADATKLLEQLLANGFIEEGGAAPAAAAAAPAAAAPATGDFKVVRARLSRAMTDILGPAGDSITEQLEACASAQDLKNYLDTKRTMLDAALGRKAAPFWALAKELLG